MIVTLDVMRNETFGYIFKPNKPVMALLRFCMLKSIRTVPPSMTCSRKAVGSHNREMVSISRAFSYSTDSSPAWLATLLCWSCQYSWDYSKLLLAPSPLRVSWEMYWSIFKTGNYVKICWPHRIKYKYGYRPLWLLSNSFDISKVEWNSIQLIQFN